MGPELPRARVARYSSGGTLWSDGCSFPGLHLLPFPCSVGLSRGAWHRSWADRVLGSGWSWPITGRLEGEEVPGDPAKCSPSPLGLGMSPCLRQACGVSGAKSLSWQHKATSGASVWEEIGGWMGGPGLRFVGISTVSASTSEPGVGRRVWRTPSSRRLPDREVWGPRHRGFLSCCGVGRRLLRILHTMGRVCHLNRLPVLRDSPEGVDTSEGSQPRGCFLEGLLSPNAHSQLPRKARVRWRRPGSAAQRRRLPGPGAAAGAAPGSHGRRQVWEPRASSP